MGAGPSLLFAVATYADDLWKGACALEAAGGMDGRVRKPNCQLVTSMEIRGRRQAALRGAPKPRVANRVRSACAWCPGACGHSPKGLPLWPRAPRLPAPGQPRDRLPGHPPSTGIRRPWRCSCSNLGFAHRTLRRPPRCGRESPGWSEGGRGARGVPGARGMQWLRPAWVSTLCPAGSAFWEPQQPRPHRL